MNLLKVWGKTCPGDPTRYHPLLFHMMDVAHVARLMWTENLGSGFRARMTEWLGLTEADEAGAGEWVVLLAGAHDLGKACPVFQSLAPELAEVLRAEGLCFLPTQDRRPHGLVSACEMSRILRAGLLAKRSSPKVAAVLSRILGAHHGVFFTPDMTGLNEGGPVLGDQEWSRLRDRLARELARVLGAHGHVKYPALGETLSAPALVPALAGLISVADWIGSAQEFFPPSSGVALEEYVPLSQSRAREALKAFGWLPPATPGGPCEFSGLFGFAPNSVQEAVIRTVHELREPYLLVVEAPMGEGKTEAALYAADHAFTAGFARGLYLALPTQATSNAMHDRVRDDYLSRRGHQGNLNLQLVHGNTLLAQAVPRVLAYDPEDEQTPGDEATANGTMSVQSWFSGAKRPLLAPFGVGTIDQAHLGVLKAKHFFVRLFGLAGKVVIFDEVHAYDTYVTSLLQRLLGWLRELGCTVVLLSATLPEQRLRELVQAYTGRKDASLDMPGYPRVALATSRETQFVSITLPNGGSDPVAIAAQPTGATASRRGEVVRLASAPYEVEAIAERVVQDVEQGGCGAVICNTVKRAVAVYDQLRCRLEEQECLLFHARTPFAWRREREREVLERFGKNGARPQRAVLVATQVVEQSLDLDFDAMYSEVAPVDLVLQRLGRLQRHLRVRPERFRNDCCLTLIGPRGESGPPSRFEGEGVYGRHFLLRSWLLLRDRTALRLPDDLERLVAEAYADADEVSPPDAEWAAALKKAVELLEAETKKEKGIAEKSMVLRPVNPELLTRKLGEALFDADDPTVHRDVRAATRLGESVSIVCLVRRNDRLVLPHAPDHSVDPDRRPGPHETRLLLEAALSLSRESNHQVYHTLVNEEPPVAWKRNGNLRFHRLVEFGDGAARVRDTLLPLALSPERGLTFGATDD